MIKKMERHVNWKPLKQDLAGSATAFSLAIFFKWDYPIGIFRLTDVGIE
jgi:hypothetical protein